MGGIMKAALTNPTTTFTMVKVRVPSASHEGKITGTPRLAVSGESRVRMWNTHVEYPGQSDEMDVSCCLSPNGSYCGYPSMFAD